MAAFKQTMMIGVLVGFCSYFLFWKYGFKFTFQVVLADTLLQATVL